MNLWNATKKTMQWFSSCVPWVTISPWAWWCTSSNTQNTIRSTAISMTVMTIYLSKDSIWPAIARLSLTVRCSEPEGDMRGRVISRVSLCLSQMCVCLWTRWSLILQLNIFGSMTGRSILMVPNLYKIIQNVLKIKYWNWPILQWTM